MTNMVDKLRHLEALRSLSERDLQELAPHFKIIHLKNRDVLFEENQPIQKLYLILYGSVKIQHQDSSNLPVILNFLGRGEFLGIAMVDLFSPRYPSTAIAIEDTALLTFSKEFFQQKLMTIPRVRELVARQVGSRFLEFQNDRCMERARIPQKLADFFLRLLEREGTVYGNRIIFPLTRKDISQRIGTHTETVIRTLSAWTKDGVIATSEHHIEILNPQRLMEIRSERNLESASPAAPVYCKPS